MSFTGPQIDAAFTKAKANPPKIEEIIDIICQEAASDAKKGKIDDLFKIEEEKVTWSVYFCSSCTFKNEENPGPKCQICLSDAPESAKVIQVSE